MKRITALPALRKAITAALLLVLASAYPVSAQDTDSKESEASSESKSSSEKKASDDRSRFVPSEEVSADQEVDFPSDI